MSKRAWKRAPYTAWRWIEDVSCGFVSFVVALSIVLGLFVFAFEPLPSRTSDLLVRVLLLLLVGAFEVIHLVCLIAAFGKQPYPVCVALKFPAFPMVVRPFVSLFWGAHLVAALGFLWFAQQVPSDTPPHLHVLAFAAASLCSFWAFGYLLLAVAAVSVSETLLLRIWEQRAWYIIVIGVAALALPYVGLAAYEPDKVVVGTEGKVLISSEAPRVNVELYIRNGGTFPIRILREPTWDDFRVEVLTPSGNRLLRRNMFLERVLWRRDEDYRLIEPGTREVMCELLVDAFAAFGSSADWRTIEGPEPVSIPFMEAGTYRLTMKYVDRAGSDFDAITGAFPFCLIVEIEYPMGGGGD